MRRLLYMALVPLFAAAVVCGCSGTKEDPSKAKRAMGVMPKENYDPLSDYSLVLFTRNTQTVRTGEGGKVTFALRNTDKKSVRIDEWYSNESDNIIVYCQPWLTGMTEPDEQAWTELSFDVKRPPIRYPLELMPGNQVLVTKQLDFVDKLVISHNAERRFFLRAKLNLKSVAAMSPVSVLIVRQGLPKLKDAPAETKAPAGTEVSAAKPEAAKPEAAR